MKWNSLVFLCFFFFFFFFLSCPSMQKFPGQGWNPCHSSDLNHCSDNAGSLNHWATGELPALGFGIDKACLKPWLSYLQAAFSLTSLNLSFLICSMGTAPNSHVECWADRKSGWYTVGPQSLLACFLLLSLHSDWLPSPCPSPESMPNDGEKVKQTIAYQKDKMLGSQ